MPTNSASLYAISKVLSPNDLGITGSHQAGILIPKKPDILGFFPGLDPEKKNPRVRLLFADISGADWEFVFIYYNSRFFDGTRNEYRLTCMTPFLKAANLKPGDELILSRHSDDTRRISIKRKTGVKQSKPGVLRLGNSWKVISI